MRPPGRRDEVKAMIGYFVNNRSNIGETKKPELVTDPVEGAGGFVNN
jgi:hypothetical protein